MKALVIGGTKGFGKEITDILSNRGYNPITVSRSQTGYQEYPHYQCDVGNLDDWRKTLQRIKSHHKTLDFLACVVGFTRLRLSKSLITQDWDQTLSRNLLYVASAFQELQEPLLASEDPRAITIGSQWSYKTGCDLLVPYTTAKHALRTLTEDFAERNPKIKANHICVPTMDTPGYHEIRRSFEQISPKPEVSPFSQEELAAPRRIASSVVELGLGTQGSGYTLRIGSKGERNEPLPK